jgi:hypothetical protein
MCISAGFVMTTPQSFIQPKIKTPQKIIPDTLIGKQATHYDSVDKTRQLAKNLAQIKTQNINNLSGASVAKQDTDPGERHKRRIKEKEALLGRIETGLTNEAFLHGDVVGHLPFDVAGQEARGVGGGPGGRD